MTRDPLVASPYPLPLAILSLVSPKFNQGSEQQLSYTGYHPSSVMLVPAKCMRCPYISVLPEQISVSASWILDILDIGQNNRKISFPGKLES